MRHDDGKKTKALQDLLESGDSITAVAKRHGVSKPTMMKWAKEPVHSIGSIRVVAQPSVVQQVDFIQAKARIGKKMLEVLEGIVDVELKIAKVLQEEGFLLQNPEEALELFKVLAARGDRYAGLVSGPDDEATG